MKPRSKAEARWRRWGQELRKYLVIGTAPRTGKRERRRTRRGANVAMRRQGRVECVDENDVDMTSQEERKLVRLLIWARGMEVSTSWGSLNDTCIAHPIWEEVVQKVEQALEEPEKIAGD